MASHWLKSWSFLAGNASVIIGHLMMIGRVQRVLADVILMSTHQINYRIKLKSQAANIQALDEVIPRRSKSHIPTSSSVLILLISRLLAQKHKRYCDLNIKQRRNQLHRTTLTKISKSTNEVVKRRRKTFLLNVKLRGNLRLYTTK